MSHTTHTHTHTHSMHTYTHPSTHTCTLYVRTHACTHHHPLTLSVECASHSNRHINPRLSINNDGEIPINDSLLTNEELSTTLTVPDGLECYGYYGYFACATDGDSASIGRIIHFSKCHARLLVQ